MVKLYKIGEELDYQMSPDPENTGEGRQREHILAALIFELETAIDLIIKEAQKMGEVGKSVLEEARILRKKFHESDQNTKDLQDITQRAKELQINLNTIPKA